jgi:hypothetical protein
MAAQPTELHARLIDIFGSPGTADPTKLYGNLTVGPNGIVTVGTALTMPDGYTNALTPQGRNRIINGDMRIQQYSTAAFASGTSGFGSADRFKAVNSNAGGNFSQSVATIAVGGGISKTFLCQTVNTAISSTTTTNYWGGLSQNIEGFNVYDLLGQPVTVSFWFYTTVPGTYSVCLFDGTAANSCVASFTAVSGTQKITLTFPALPTTLGVSLNNSMGIGIAIGFLNTGSYQTSTLNAWQSGIYRSATGAVNWGATANNVIGIAELQLEPGVYATPFERVNIGEQLLRCQRYYEVLSGGQYAVGGVQNATSAFLQMSWTTPKRAAPTITGTAASTYYFYSSGTNNIAPSSWTASASLSKAIITVNIASGGVAGQACLLEDNSGSAVYISSEL